MRDILEFVVPLAALVCFFSIPLVALLLRHQRQMAELTRRETAGSAELLEIRNEVRALRDQLNRLTLQLDDQRLPQRPPEIPTRV